QSLQCQGQRRGLLLPLAAARRTVRRRERHPLSSDAAPDYAREPDRHLLTAVVIAGRPAWHAATHALVSLSSGFDAASCVRNRMPQSSSFWAGVIASKSRRSPPTCTIRK